MEDTEDYQGDEGQDVIEDVVVTVEESPSSIADIARETRLYASHPECKVDVERSVMALAEKIGDCETDPNHKSSPYLNKYERTAVLSFRAAQLQKRFPPFVTVPSHITDVYDIAKMELAQKKIPFIIKRTMPDGSAEYWRIRDLIIVE